MKRRNFIKKSFIVGAGSALFLSGKSFSKNNLPLLPNFKPNPSSWNRDEINISWIGHSTVLINFYGKIILTDPVLFNRVGIYMFGTSFGPSRYTAPALEVDEIPKPDLILLSHAHMDHMDYPTLKHLSKKFKNQIDCITAFNTMDVIEDLPWRSIAELDWTEETNYSGIKIKAIEVTHFGWRFPWERDRSRGFMNDGRSFNAYLLSYNGNKILFGGDTAYTDLFKSLNETVDIAIMPIGAYYPWRKNHCTPEEALEMASHLKAKVFIPIHFNTFKQGLEPRTEPMEKLNENFSSYNISIGLKEIGQTFTA